MTDNPLTPPPPGYTTTPPTEEGWYKVCHNNCFMLDHFMCKRVFIFKGNLLVERFDKWLKVGDCDFLWGPRIEFP